MRVAIRRLRALADDHPSLLADPCEGRIPHGTDDDQPRRRHAVLLLAYIMAGDNLTNRGPVALTFDLDHVWWVALDRREFLCATREWQNIFAVGFSRHTHAIQMPCGGVMDPRGIPPVVQR